MAGTAPDPGLPAPLSATEPQPATPGTPRPGDGALAPVAALPHLTRFELQVIQAALINYRLAAAAAKITDQATRGRITDELAVAQSLITAVMEAQQSIDVIEARNATLTDDAPDDAPEFFDQYDLAVHHLEAGRPAPPPQADV